MQSVRVIELFCFAYINVWFISLSKIRCFHIWKYCRGGKCVYDYGIIVSSCFHYQAVILKTVNWLQPQPSISFHYASILLEAAMPIALNISHILSSSSMPLSTKIGPLHLSLTRLHSGVPGCSLGFQKKS